MDATRSNGSSQRRSGGVRWGKRADPIAVGGDESLLGGVALIGGAYEADQELGAVLVLGADGHARLDIGSPKEMLIDEDLPIGASLSKPWSGDISRDLKGDARGGAGGLKPAIKSDLAKAPGSGDRVVVDGGAEQEAVGDPDELS